MRTIHLTCFALLLFSMQVHCFLTHVLEFLKFSSGGSLTHCQEKAICEAQLALILENVLCIHFGSQPEWWLIPIRESMKNHLQILEFRMVVGFWFVCLCVFFLWEIYITFLSHSE